jgi:hypothetical protein
MTPKSAHVEAIKGAAHAAASDFWDLLVRDCEPGNEVDKGDIADAVEHVLAVILPEMMRLADETKMARIRAALADCIDSLEYVDRAHPGTSGWGVRAARVEAAKDALTELSEKPSHVAWNDAHNRYYQPVEERAAQIYAAFPYDGPGAKPSWTPHGNATMQDEARRLARTELRGLFHQPHKETVR